MKKQITKIAGLMAGICLAACGGRVANLTPTTTALDSKLSCTHLFGEHQNLDKRLAELTGERGDKPLHNVGMLLTSPLFLDLSGAQKEEGASILKRQERLGELMQSKSCAQFDVIEAAKAAAEREATSQ